MDKIICIGDKFICDKVEQFLLSKSVSFERKNCYFFFNEENENLTSLWNEISDIYVKAVTNSKRVSAKMPL